MDDVRKEDQRRSVPLSENSNRTGAVAINGRQGENGTPLREENILNYADMARELVMVAWPEIVRGLIKKAADGGYQQTRLLLDICNLAESDAPLQNGTWHLCDVLLEELNLLPLPADEGGKNAADGKTDSKSYEA